MADVKASDMSKWAGNYDCKGCGRKRLIAAEFSQKMIAKKHENPDHPMRCKKCTEATGEAERAAAAKKVGCCGTHFGIPWRSHMGARVMSVLDPHNLSARHKA